MTALDRQAAIVAALLAALEADAALSTMIGLRIYDAPPARVVVPAITIKLVSGADASTADTEAQSLVFDFDVWDRYEAGADLSRPRAVMANIRRILHLQPLAVPNITVLTMRCTGARGPERNPDEVALHGVVTLTVLAGHETVFE